MEERGAVTKVFTNRSQWIYTPSAANMPVKSDVPAKKGKEEGDKKG
jgi:hypothetical protein